MIYCHRISSNIYIYYNVEDNLPNFSGKWTLRTSEKLDEYLKDEGWGIIMRKAAAAARSTQTIKQDYKSITIKVRNTNKVFEYTAQFDGSQTKYIDNDKDVVVSRTMISDDRTQIIEKMEKVWRRQYTTYRYMDNGEMKLKIENWRGTYCIRIYKKVDKLQNYARNGARIRYLSVTIMSTLHQNKGKKYKMLDEYVVFGFINNIQQALPSQYNAFFTIPQSIKVLCLKYFGMNSDLL